MIDIDVLSIDKIERLMAQQLGTKYGICEENLMGYQPIKDKRKAMAEIPVKGLKRFLANIKK